MFDAQLRLATIRGLADKWATDEKPVYPPLYSRGYLLGQCFLLRGIVSDRLMSEVLATEDYVNEAFDKRARKVAA